MPKKQGQNRNKTLLVFNCHEAWVHQLGVLGYNLDIITGLKGRYKKDWDEQMRPLPANSRLIGLSEAYDSQEPYYCIIAHNITDLLDVKLLSGPRLIVLHSTLEGRAVEEKSDITPSQMRELLHKYLQLVGGHAVAASKLKGESWCFVEDIVPFGADPDEYLPYSGDKACGLRISNFIANRRKILLWDFHEKSFAGIPVRLVGHNPDMPEVEAAASWEQLKQIFQSHRFYIHTADPMLEDGYNMATLEAMAAGLPVLGNLHPGSPIEHEVSGFLSDEPEELHKYARMLLEDRDLAAKMGQQARKVIKERFSMDKFKEAFLLSIETARLKHQGRAVAT